MGSTTMRSCQDICSSLHCAGITHAGTERGTKASWSRGALAAEDSTARVEALAANTTRFGDGWLAAEASRRCALAPAAAFGDLEDLVGVEVSEGLCEAGGPADFEGVDAGVGAEAEVLAELAGGAEAFAAFDFAVDGKVGGFEGDLGTDGVAVGLYAGEVDFEPVVAVAFEIAVEGVVGVVAGVVAAELGVDVEGAVVVDVDEGDAVALCCRGGAKPTKSVTSGRCRRRCCGRSGWVPGG